MHRRLAPVVVLCLAAVAVLGVGAVPAAAQDGCECHTAAVPPTNTPPAAHALWVAGVTDCTVCHVQWTVPHPAADSPQATFRLKEDATALSGWVGLWRLGVLGHPGKTVPHPGVAVYLQQWTWGQMNWTGLGQATTDADGNFAFTLAAPPPPFTTFRAVVVGHTGGTLDDTTALFRAGFKATQMTPQLTLTYTGLRNGVLTLGKAVKATATVAPADIGITVRLRFEKRVAGEWKVRKSAEDFPTEVGTLTLRFAPKSRGLFRAVAETGRLYYNVFRRMGMPSSLWSLTVVNGTQFRVR